MRHFWRNTVDNERGSVLLIAVLVVAVMSLLGVALFELSTIEAGLTTHGDVGDAQAFYCAEGALAYTYKNATDIGRINTGNASPWGIRSASTVSYTYPALSANYQANNPGVPINYGSYTVSVVSTGGTTPTPTVTAACVQQNGVTRIVQAGLNYPNSIYEFAVVSGNSGALAKGFGNFYLGGADSVSGDIYVANTAALRGAPVLTPCFSTSDPICDPTNKNPQLTAIGGLSETSNIINQSDPASFGNTELAPTPDLTDGSKPEQFVSRIRSAVGRQSPSDLASTGQMTGTYNGSTVYNLTKIFADLGSTSEGNSERNLAKPSGCSYLQAAPTGSPCQVWQDLLYVGVRRATGADPGPSDAASYYFMGIPRSPSNAPQGTSFSTIYANMVGASAELQQMGFTTSMSNLGSRLDALAGQDSQNLVTSDKSVNRLVDVTTGTDATGRAAPRAKAPIFFIDDGYFRVQDGTNYAYNGIATVITSKSILLADNIIYLNGIENKATSLPDTCSNINDRKNCGLPDVLGLVAQKDIWVGDPGASGATVEWLSGVMLAGNDVNYLGYNSASACCQGVSNPVTLNGTVMASRQATLARDWSDPQVNDENSSCNSAGTSGCRPVQYYPNDGWKYMTIETNPRSASFGALVPCSTLTWNCGPSNPTATCTGDLSLTCPQYITFQGCEGNQTCTRTARRITHFQLNVKYESRLWHNSALIPPGLPTGNSTLPVSIIPGTWKECDARYYPGAPNSLFDSNNHVTAACP
jgi:hypothetical protein